MLGTFLLKVVDEEELIDEAVEELERSGLLEDSAFFRRSNGGSGLYGSLEGQLDGDAEDDDTKVKGDEEARKKTWLLNEETRRFLKDHTMWWLAGGFFFVSGMFLPCCRLEQMLTF
jgi:hypothetical protein